MMTNSNNSIQSFKEQLNIVDVISRVVPLKRSGSGYVGVCPFHNEKTPSFSVSEQKQIFKCFGCGASGNVIEFTKKYYNLDFKEAVEKLAKENGIEFQFGGSNSKRLDKYYEVNKVAARFFYSKLTQGKNKGYSYFRSRGIKDETIKTFGLGYGGESWDELYNHLKSNGFEDKIMVELGLVSKSKKDGKFYDRFRNRVIFPIINTAGKVIGFGGRILGDGVPKYLNSPESPVFRKQNNLYGLNLSKQYIGKSSNVILVEGYMDVISLYQNGVVNVGASLGTALTQNQAKLLKRYTKNVVLCYDSDNAGINAALRGMEILDREDLKVRVLHVTDGKDPDEYVKSNGKEAYLKLVDNAMPMIDYKLNSIKKKYNLKEEVEKIDYMKEAMAYLKNRSPIERDIYINKLSEDLNISKYALESELKGIKISDFDNKKYSDSGYEHKTKDLKEEQTYKDMPYDEVEIFRCLLENPGFTTELLENMDGLEFNLSKKVGNIIFDLYGTKGDFTLDDILNRLEIDEAKYFFDKINNGIGKSDSLVFKDLILRHKSDILQEKINSLHNRIKMKEQEEAPEVVDEWMRKIIELNDKKVKIELELHERGK